MAEKIICAGYVRVSSDDQTELSPDSQIKKLKEYAEANNMILSDEYIFRDDGISGRHTDKRPEFNRMIAIAKRTPPPFSTIIVWKFSRFARNREDSIVFKSMLKKNGVSVVSVSEPIGDDKMSILVESLIEAMDEYYSVNLSEETKRGLQERFSRGKHLASPPLGYKYVSEGNMIPDENADTVREIFKLFLSGMSYNEISRRLLDKGIKSKRGKSIGSQSVYVILTNRVYNGEVSCGKVWSQGTHEPIISKEDFAEAQRIIDSRPKYTRTIMKNEYMLMGLVKCSSCGSNLVLNNKTHLECASYNRGACRTTQRTSMSILEDEIIKALEHDLSEIHLNIVTSPSKRSDDRRKELTTLLAKAKNKLNRARNAYINEIDTISEYKDNKKRISNEIDELETEISKLSTHEVKPDTVHEKIKDALSLIKSPDISELVKNRALKSFIDKIVYDRANETLTIYYKLS